jgi:hypothetical protein
VGRPIGLLFWVQPCRCAGYIDADEPEPWFPHARETFRHQVTSQLNEGFQPKDRCLDRPGNIFGSCEHLSNRAHFAP